SMTWCLGCACTGGQTGRVRWSGRALVGYWGDAELSLKALGLPPAGQTTRRLCTPRRSRVQLQASAMDAAGSRPATQPRPSFALTGEATSTAGSPGRRGASTVGIGRPVTDRAISMIWRTEVPVPLPRL